MFNLENLVVALVVNLIIVGVLWLLFIVSKSAASGRLGRNHAVGIRVASLLDSDEKWRVGHGAAVAPLRITALGTTMTAVINTAVVGSPFWYVATFCLLTGTGAVGVLVSTSTAVKTAKRLPS